MDFKKKGFTLVELVVVIAVIAVLAAVLIPTFTSLIRKADVSTDTGLVKNFNLALKSESVTTRPITPTDALNVVAKYGFYVDKLATRSNGEVIWDSENNQFALVEWKDNAFSVVYSEKSLSNSPNRIWIFRSQIDDVVNKGYSVYLKSDFNATNATVKAGIDVGENQNINIIYDRQNVTTVADGQTAIIRTNGGNLTVNAPADNVNHYGTITNVDIIAIAGNSYHENGIVSGNLIVTKGRVVVEDKAEVSYVVVASEQVADVKVDVKPQSEVTAIVATNETVKNALETTIVTGNKESIDDSVVVNKESASNDLFNGGFGTMEYPYLIATAKQFSNISTFKNDWELSTRTAIYFDLIDDIDLSKLNSNYSAMSEYFCGSLNGNNHKIIVDDSKISDFIFKDAIQSAVFKDIQLVLDKNLVRLCPGNAIRNTTITFNNVDITTLDPTTIIALGQNTGLFGDWLGNSYTQTNPWVGGVNVVCANCDVIVNLIGGTTYNAVFYGGAPYYSTLEVTDCSYNGTYQGKLIGLVTGNGTSAYHTNSLPNTIIVNHFANKGTLICTGGNPAIIGASEIKGSTEVLANLYAFGTVNDTRNIGTCIHATDTNLALNKDLDNQLIITKSSNANANYVVTVITGCFTNGISEYSRYKIDIEIPSFTTDTYATGIYSGYFVSASQYKEIAGDNALDDVEWTTTDDGRVYTIKEFNGTYYFVINLDGYQFGVKTSTGFVAKAISAISAQVSSYVDGDVKGIATLNDFRI